MNLFVKWSLTALTLLGTLQSASAETLCSFQVRSTIEGNDKLSDHAFKVRFAHGAHELEQRTGDGGWLSYGSVQRFDRPGFTVYLHLPTNGPIQSQSLMLSVQTSGAASLYIHHGQTGGAWNSNRAWLYHGNCSNTAN